MDELVGAYMSNDQLGVRQAAEKAWLAVVEATDWFLADGHNIRVDADERAHLQRRKYLLSLDRGDLERTYSHLAQTLHGDVFYFAEPFDPATLRRFFEEAAGFVEETTGEAGLVQAVWERLSRV